MKYLYVNKQNELFVCGHKTDVLIGGRMLVVANDKTVITGTLQRKCQNGVMLTDWDILNSEQLFKDL